MSDLIDDVVEAARLLGGVQTRKEFGCYTQEDARFELAMYESIDDKTKRLRAERDALKADAERLRAERDELARQFDPMGEYTSADELIAALRAEKAEDEAMKRDAECWRELDQMMSDPDARLNVNAGGWAVLKCGLIANLGASNV